MPRLNPVHIPRLRPTNRAVQMSRQSAIQIRTPRVEKPVQLRFQPENPQVAGAVYSNIHRFAQTAQKYAVRHAQQVAESEALERVEPFYNSVTSTLYGDKKNPGFLDSPANIFVKQVDATVDQIKSGRKKIAAELSPYAQQVFFKETEAFTRASINAIYKRKAKAWNEYSAQLQQQYLQTRISNIANQAVEATKNLVTNLPEERAARQSKINSLIASEAVNLASKLGIAPEAARDRVILGVLQNLYSREDGDILADLYVEDWRKAMSTPEDKLAIDKLQTDYYTRQAKAFEKYNKTTEELDKYHYNQRRSLYLSQLKTFHTKAEAEKLIQQAYTFGDYEGRKVKSLVGAYFVDAKDLKPSIRSLDFESDAILQTWSAEDAAYKAKQKGIDLTRTQLQHIATARVAGVGKELTQYTDRFKAEFSALLGVKTGILMIDKLMGNEPVDAGTKQYLTWKNELVRTLKKAALAHEDLEQAYDGFVSIRLNPDKFKDQFRLTSKQSIAPVGLYKQINLDNLSSWRDVANAMQSFPIDPKFKSSLIKIGNIASDPSNVKQEAAIARLRKIYMAFQRDLYEQSDPDLAKDWERELPFQWLSIESQITSSKLK